MYEKILLALLVGFLCALLWKGEVKSAPATRSEKDLVVPLCSFGPLYGPWTEAPCERP